jgi:TonB family protein
MHVVSFLAVLWVAVQAGFSQTAGNTAASQAGAPGLPKDPREVIEAARPFYDFSDAALKPWHLKTSYQLYDDKGNPGEQGTFEYWWASPDVHRTLWTRGSSMHSDWRAGGNKYASRSEGEPLRYFEYKMFDALLSPLPEEKDMDPVKSRIERKQVSLGNLKVPCIMVGPIIGHFGQGVEEPIGLFPTFCFDSNTPALLVTYSLGGVTTVYNKIVKVQGKYLAREVTFFQGKQKILSATVDSITGLNPMEAALALPPDTPVSNVKKVNIAGGLAQGMLLKKEVPFYPQDAKAARVSGTVILQAVIGTDGSIHDLRVVSAPWPSLAAASLWAVSHWQYKPYLLNGSPVEVETTINVVFSLSD